MLPSAFRHQAEIISWNQIFSPVGDIEVYFGLLLLECGKVITDMPFLENYKSFGINKSVVSLASNILKHPNYLKLTTVNVSKCAYMYILF